MVLLVSMATPLVLLAVLPFLSCLEGEGAGLLACALHWHFELSAG